MRDIQFDPVRGTPLHADFYEVDLTKRIEVLRIQSNAGFKLDVRRPFSIRKEAPACVFKQLVNLNASGGFFHANIPQFKAS